MEHAVSRISSISTARTLVGTEDGETSPVSSPVSFKTRPGIPIGQTPDNKQWIDIDFISPKLLRELSRQFDRQRHGICTPSDENGVLAKGAAKIRAWTRQTTKGLDIRLRKKIDPRHDEVTDFQLVREPDHKPGEPNLLPEMPSGNAIYEMPDTSILPELSAVNAGPIPMELPGNIVEEQLPRYEPLTQPTTQQCPVLRVDIPESGSTPETTAGRPPSASSIVLTPTRGLSIRDSDVNPEPEPEPETIGEKIADVAVHDDQKPSAELHPLDNLGKDGTPSSGNSKKECKSEVQSNGMAEELHGLLIALKAQLADQTLPATEPVRDVDHFRLAQTVRHETETDAEPPSPASPKRHQSFQRRVSRQRTILSTSKAKGPKMFGRTKPGSGENEPFSSENAALPRRRTVSERVPPNAGAETAWLALLKAQAKILGPEHPLTFQAKHALSLSRVHQHHHCPTNLLDALRETENAAIHILGKVHPLVETFTADLHLLEGIITDNSSVQPEADMEENDNVFHSVSDDIPKQDFASFVQTPITDSSVVDASQAGEKRTRDALWNTSLAPHRPKTNAAIFMEQVFTSILTELRNGISWLEHTYGPEPALAPGKVRVRWTCSCGAEIYDDFVERRRGAARELEAYLNRPRTHSSGTTTTSPGSSTGNHSSNGSLNSSFSGASTQTSWTSYSQISESPNGGTKRSQTASSLPPYTPFTPLAEPPWLLTCANEDHFTPKVAHLDVSPHKITSDRDLAKALRQHYFDVKRKWWKKLRMRGLATIEFVQFECHQNRFADIRKCPDMPQGTDDYAFEPGELIPPVGSKYLLHLFKHPEDYDGELITYLRAPKKKNGRLQLGVGWGINLVEGFLADRVWLVLNVFFVFVSVIFAIAWACERHDIQGAFGVVSWVCALSVLTGGWLQTILG